VTTVLETLDRDQPVFSVEFFPPRSDEDEAILWKTIRQLEALDPAFVSVTYGAGGSSRDRTIRTTARIAAETTLVPMAHLTGVNHSIAELRNVVGWYAANGIRNILVVRGDPPGDPMGEWIPHPDGITYADELVQLVDSLGEFCIAVAAFPGGHPRSADVDVDTDHLTRKIDMGASLAIAQISYEVDDFLRLRDRLAARSCDAVLLPGILPLTTVRTLSKVPELSGSPAPEWVHTRLAPHAEDPRAFRAEGMEITAELCTRLLAEGVPGLHFYSLNRATATRELVHRLGLAPTRKPLSAAVG
jgi:methylenetetrahydrofolate reductase (NADPH)